jgi:hypothetical protein
MHLQLDDQSICCLVVIVKDVPVRIMNSFIPVDFMVLEMDVCCQTSLIIGKSFLSTAEATIDVAAEIIKLNIKEGGDLHIQTKENRVLQPNKVINRKHRGNAKAPRKKPDIAKYSKPKSIWRVKNATPIVPPSPVARVN